MSPKRLRFLGGRAQSFSATALTGYFLAEIQMGQRINSEPQGAVILVRTGSTSEYTRPAQETLHVSQIASQSTWHDILFIENIAFRPTRRSICFSPRLDE